MATESSTVEKTAKKRVKIDLSQSDKYSQLFNPATGHYLLRDVETRKFVKIKRDGQPFAGISIEPQQMPRPLWPGKRLANRMERAWVVINEFSLKNAA